MSGKNDATQPEDLNFDYKYGFSVPARYIYKADKGLSEEVVRKISELKKEPAWMLDFRLRSLGYFLQKPMPGWGPDLSGIDFSSITYYAKPSSKAVKSWEDLPAEIKETYDKIGVPEAERNFLAGVSAQFDSEVVYENMRKEIERLGVIFCDMDTGVRKYPEIVKKYFGKLVPPADNKFAALNSAVWSGGSFVYVPKGVKVPMPLQAYFRINAQNFGQFERTLIIAEEGAFVHYVEGCLPGFELVMTEKGACEISSLKIGDKVFTHKGHLKKVKKLLTRRYKGEVYRITPISPYNSFELTQEHPVLAIKRKDVLVKRSKRKDHWLEEVDTEKLIRTKPEFIPVSKLERGDFLVFPKPVVRGEDVRLSMDQVELLGYYLAEGSISYHKTLRQYIVSFSIGLKEEKIAERISYLIQKTTGKKPNITRVEKKSEIRVSVYSKELALFLEKHAGKYADKKKLSPEILALPENLLEKLFWAYFAGDGNITLKKSAQKKSRFYRASTASRELAFQLQFVLARLGVYASIQLRQGGEDKIQGREIIRKDQYIIVFTKDKSWSEIRETRDYFLVPIKDIKVYDYDDLVFNVEIEEDESYLVKGFAVHNCTAPIYSTDSLHAAVVEIFVHPKARVRYTTVQNWSHNVYNLVTKRSRVEKDAVMEWVDCNIGCLIGSTKVFSERGVVDIKDIKEGDKVFSIDPKDLKTGFFRVKAKKMTGIRKTYLLKTEKHNQIQATDNHPFLVMQRLKGSFSKLYTLAWKQLKDIKNGDYIAVQNSFVPYQKEKLIKENFKVKGSRISFSPPKVLDKDYMWFLGVYLGDGYIEFGKGTKKPKRVYFAVPPKDRIRKKLKEFILKRIGITPKEKGICLTINSVEFATFINSLGFGHLARGKTIPDWVFTLPLDQRLSFIRGFIESDGYIRKNKKDKPTSIVLATANLELLKKIRILMIISGLRPLKILSYVKLRSLYKGKEKIYKSYYLTLNYAENKKIFEEVKSKDIAALRFERVVEIEEKEKQKVYDIQIERCSNFFAEGILVHNSKITMKYPSCILAGEGAKGEVLSIAYAAKDQIQDTGAKMIHLAPNTTSRVISKSISKDGGRTSYRGLVQVSPGAFNSSVFVSCDALILDERSRSDTYPYMKIKEQKGIQIQHEATVEKIGEEKLFYLTSRGISKPDAEGLLVQGFVEPVAKEIPLEYAVELNRLIRLEMEGSVG